MVQGVTDSALVALRPQGVSKHGRPLPPSKEPFDTRAYEAFQAKPLEAKREYLRNQWLDIAHIVLSKAKLFSRSATKKDFGKLVQLLMSAGIAWDKVFPKDQPQVNGNIILNLFNGLPQDKALKVIGTVEQPVDVRPSQATTLIDETRPPG